MRRRELAAAMAFITAVSAVPMAAEAADNNQDYRRKVVGIAGIMNVSTGIKDAVTRAEFAHMLVQASTYREFLPVNGSVSVYADVPATAQYASSIRIAAEQNWMTGYLGGNFKPDQPVTLNEAARGALALLGYTNEDFGGSVSNARMAKFYDLELNENLNRQPSEILDRTDGVNLFYNLLKTKMKTGDKVYGTVLGCQLNSDGEINQMGLADPALKGPKLVSKGSQLGDHVPFNVQQASIYINGEAGSYETLKSCISNSYVVIYYNQTAKTIWAYVADDDVQLGRCAVRGTVQNIYYTSSDVMTPSAITLDNGQEYKLTSSDMQFAFSVYGAVRVGDRVTLVCEKTENSNGDVTYTVVDYVED